MEEEIWKDISGYEGLYQISNFGNCKRLSHFIRSKNNGKTLLPDLILKQSERGEYKHGTRYNCFKLYKNTIGKIFSTHRLVSSAFIPNPKNKKVINHKDANKHNNVYTNLEWNTDPENREHAKINNLMARQRNEDNGNCILTNDKVNEIRKIDKRIKGIDIAEHYNISINYVYSIRSGLTRKYCI